MKKEKEKDVLYEPHYDAESWALYFVDGPLEGKDYFGGEINVFVCGSLQHPGKMVPLIGRNAPFAPAFARGYSRRWEKVGGRDVPFMLPAPDNPRRALTGIVWLVLSEEEVERIENVELHEDLRKRIAITVKVGERDVEAVTYIKR